MVVEWFNAMATPAEKSQLLQPVHQEGALDRGARVALVNNLNSLVATRLAQAYQQAFAFPSTDRSKLPKAVPPTLLPKRGTKKIQPLSCSAIDQHVNKVLAKASPPVQIMVAAEAFSGWRREHEASQASKHTHGGEGSTASNTTKRSQAGDVEGSASKKKKVDNAAADDNTSNGGYRQLTEAFKAFLGGAILTARCCDGQDNGKECGACISQDHPNRYDVTPGCKGNVCSRVAAWDARAA
jgi:hypothetical protein